MISRAYLQKHPYCPNKKGATFYEICISRPHKPKKWGLFPEIQLKGGEREPNQAILPECVVKKRAQTKRCEDVCLKMNYVRTGSVRVKKVKTAFHFLKNLNYQNKSARKSLLNEIS